MAEWVQVPFCHIHGYAHYNGEMDDQPDEADCREEDWTLAVAPADPVEVVDERPLLRRSFTDAFILEAGSAAYVDSRSAGLVPCKVLDIAEDGSAHIIVTANRQGWKRGEEVDIGNPRMSLIAREQVDRTGRIAGRTLVRTDKGRVL